MGKDAVGILGDHHVDIDIFIKTIIMADRLHPILVGDRITNREIVVRRPVFGSGSCGRHGS